jgi:hypothetical protein
MPEVGTRGRGLVARVALDQDGELPPLMLAS